MFWLTPSSTSTSTSPLGGDTSSLTMTQLNDAIKRWCSFPSPLVTVKNDEAAPDVQVEELHSAWAKPNPNSGLASCKERALCNPMMQLPVSEAAVDPTVASETFLTRKHQQQSLLNNGNL